VIETCTAVPEDLVTEFEKIEKDKDALDAFFYRWALRRWASTKGPAIYVLICRQPHPYRIEFIFKRALLKKEFRLEDRKVIMTILRDKFAEASKAEADERQRFFDQGLIAACAYARSTFQTNGVKK